ncbi:MAG: hypothetical protein V4724_22710 [Pseudomonadota bacterium]
MFKSISVVVALAALGGCAVVPANQAYYGARTQVVNPYEWHTVSTVPVQRGSGGQRVEYTTEAVPQQPPVAYVSEPVYVGAPVYVAQPAYYYPPVSIGFDFVFGNWGHRYGGGRGRWRGR